MKQGVSAGVVINDVSLRPYNTLAIPARSSYFILAETQAHLEEALDYAHQHQLPVCVIGEGSNLVFTSDHKGLIILLRTQGVELLDESESEVVIRVAAGENWHALVKTCLQQGWHGLENLALIPGLVGAAPIQNIGAYGVEVKDFIRAVSVIDIATKSVRTLSNKQCEFAYRDSVFKQALRDRVIITEVEFVLSKVAKPQLSYAALADKLSSHPSPEQVFDAVCAIRSSKLPHPKDVPNAGSFFKNPVVSKAELDDLKQKYPDIVAFPFQHNYKLAAAWLIDHQGWKKRVHRYQQKDSQVRVHSQQALVLTNPGAAVGAEVLSLAYAIQSDIENEFGVQLEIEPRLV